MGKPKYFLRNELLNFGKIEHRKLSLSDGIGFLLIISLRKRNCYFYVFFGSSLKTTPYLS
jgi:hypothetical protein